MGLILSIVSLIFSFCCCGCLPLNVLSLIFSAIGLAQINRQPEVYTGKGEAIAGLVISVLGLILGAGMLLIGIGFNLLGELNKF